MNIRRKRLRELLKEPDVLSMPGVFDGYSARLLAASPFEAGFISGGGISEAAIGWSDYGLLGRGENLQVCRALVECCEVPLIADCDTGYGNAVNVHFTVRAFEQIGVAGVMLEDQVWPKRCGHLTGKQVISAQEAADKIRAAAYSRQDPDLVIMARTDSYATHGLDEVIRRLNSFADAGADIAFADALLSSKDISTVARNVRIPLCVNMGFGIRHRATTPQLSSRELKELGAAVAIYPRILTAAAVMGMKTALQELSRALNSGIVIDREDLLVSFEELNELTGLKDLQKLEKEFNSNGG